MSVTKLPQSHEVEAYGYGLTPLILHTYSPHDIVATVYRSSSYKNV